MAQHRERRELVRQMMSDLHSSAEIREALIDRYSISERTAYDDIAKAQEMSYHSEGRERMHLGVVESIRARYRAAMSSTRHVECPECKFEGAVERRPNLREADRAIAGLIRTFKLELTPEELLNDEELAEQVAKATIKHMHMWRPDDLREAIEVAQRLLDQSGDQ